MAASRFWLSAALSKVKRSALAVAAMPATFSVVERLSLSCPPLSIAERFSCQL